MRSERLSRRSGYRIVLENSYRNDERLKSPNMSMVLYHFEKRLRLIKSKFAVSNNPSYESIRMYMQFDYLHESYLTHISTKIANRDAFLAVARLL